MCVCVRDAWKSVQGTSKKDAEDKYVEKLTEVISYSLSTSCLIFSFLLGTERE